MRYGINLPNGGLTGDPHTVTELAALAEGSGWAGVFLEDYIVWQGHQEVPTYDPWILGAGLGDTTLDISFTHFGEVIDVKQRGEMLDEALTDCYFLKESVHAKDVSRSFDSAAGAF